MRSKAAEPGETLEGDPPEDECGVSSSVPQNVITGAGGLGSSKWYSAMKQPAFSKHTNMLYVNLESCPSSPTYLERDPNMSCTARYSPAAYSSTTPNSGNSQPSSSLNSTSPSSSSVEGTPNGIITQEHYQREESHQQYLQYQTLSTERLAPLLQVLDGVTTSGGTSYFSSTTDSFGVSSSNNTIVPSCPVSTSADFVSTTNPVCERTPQVQQPLYMPISQPSSEITTQSSSVGHQSQLMDTTDLQFILTSDCEYHMMENGKVDQVELFIARDQSGTSYSVTTENGFLIARPTLTPCSPVKLENTIADSNDISVGVSILDPMDETTQFEEECHNIAMESFSGSNLHFNQSDELVLHSNSNGGISPSRLEEVECGQLVDFEEIVEYLGSQPSTPIHEEILSSEEVSVARPNRKRQQQQQDTSIMCIPDKTVPCRARASLPATHLSLRTGPESTVKGVFARRRIPIRARFGPLEGSKKKLSKLYIPNNSQDALSKFLIRTDSGDYIYDISDERTSNWMRYVRFEPGPLQNLCLHQSDNELFFITCRPIAPKQELILGYGFDYAKLWKLPTPPDFAIESNETTSEWPCYECSLGFPSSAELQGHLSTHDDEDKLSNKKSKKKPSKGNNATLHDCQVCAKSFSSEISLKRHVQSHQTDGSSAKNTNHHNYVMDQQLPVSSSVEKSISIMDQIDYNVESAIKRENLQNKKRSNNFSHSIAPHSLLKRETHYHSEQEQLVPDSQMDNDSLDSNCTDVNTEESYEAIQKDVTSLDSNVELFLCNICNKVMDSALQLEMHCKDHEMDQLKAVPCHSHPTECLSTMKNENDQNKSSIIGSPSSHILTKDTINIVETSDGGNATNKNKIGEGGKKMLYIHCPMCPKIFKSGPQFKDHVQSQHTRPDGKYDCPLCSMVLPDYRTIKRHIQVFHAIKSISCPECGSNFATNDKLRLHMLKHSDRRDFECTECGKRFKRRDKLKDHTKKQHSGEAKILKVKEPSSPPVDPTAYLSFTFKCHPCKRGFKRRGMLVNHLAKRHPDIVRTTVPELQLPILKVARNYYCQHCDKVYKSSSKRKVHIIKNHPGESIPPSSRGKGLGTASLEGKEGFSKCVGAVTSAPQVCPYQPCHKQYASKAKLLQHIRLKHVNQVIESKENKMNKNLNTNSVLPKSDVSSSSSVMDHFTDKQQSSDLSEMKIMKPNNKACYPQYDSVNEKIVFPNILTKSRPDQTSPNTGLTSKWDHNGKILCNLLNSVQPHELADGKYTVVEPTSKPLTEIKLGEYLTGSSSKQSYVSTALIGSLRNNGTRLRIIQLDDGTQMIEELDENQTEISKKSNYSKMVDGGQNENMSGHLIMESNKLPPVSVLAGNTNKSRYTDR